MKTAELPAMLESNDLTHQVKLLRDARVWIEHADAGEVIDLTRKAQLAAKWVKLTKAAHSISVEAVRLECVGLRKLAQMKVTKPAGINSVQMAAGARFAAMSDSDFDAMIAGVDQETGATVIHKAFLKDERLDDAKSDGERMANGGVRPDYSSFLTVHEMARAASAMLNEYTLADVPFTVAEVAEDLSKNLGGADTAATREGYRCAVREAIRMSSHDDSSADDWRNGAVPDGTPKWITYYEDAAGWVRVPAAMATIGQLEAMVLLRKDQAARLTEIAERIEGVYAVLNEYTNPTADRLGAECKLTRLAERMRRSDDARFYSHVRSTTSV